MLDSNRSDPYENPDYFFGCLGTRKEVCVRVSLQLVLGLLDDVRTVFMLLFSSEVHICLWCIVLALLLVLFLDWTTGIEALSIMLADVMPCHMPNMHITGYRESTHVMENVRLHFILVLAIESESATQNRGMS